MNKGLKQVLKYKNMYILFIPCFIYLIIFNYIPMFGIVLAFKDYSIKGGIFGSEWVGLENFKELFETPDFFKVTWNTLKISFYKLVFGFPLPIIISLLLNELRSMRFKKTIQTIIFLPHFISWVILSGIIFSLFRVDGGIINELIILLGGEKIPFLSDNRYFVKLLVSTNIWKGAGWGTIVYLAAITGIDPSYYEAAEIDGASRFQKMLYITVPGIMVAVTINLILQLSNVLSAGFDQVFNLYSPPVYDTADIIDTYVYRNGIIEGKYEMSTALGVFKSITAFVLIMLSNYASKKLGGDGIW